MKDVSLSRQAAMERGELEHKVFELEAQHYYSDASIEEDIQLREKSLRYIAISGLLFVVALALIYLSIFI